MTPYLRLPLGGVALAGGAFLLPVFGARIAASVLAGGGLALPDFVGAALGVLCLGAALDFFAGPRPAPKESDEIAKSIWATAQHVKAYGIGEADTPEGDDGPYLGVFAGEGQPAAIRYRGPKHLLVFGPPGASKSMGLVVPNLAHLRRSMIVIDPKSQLTAICARKRASMGRVITLDPFGRFSSSWNPLLQLNPDSDDFAGDAFCIADALVEKSGGGGNHRFFEDASENLVAAMAMWERYDKGDRASLRNMRRELADLPGLKATLKKMSESRVFAIQVAGERAYSRLTDEQSHANSLQDVIETVLAGTRFLDDPRIGRDMTGPAIDFAEFHRSITTLFVCLPMHELTAQAKWLRLLVNLSLRGLYQNPPTNGATLPPVAMILDEFANVGRLTEIIKALGAARDYSIQLFMVLQSLSQLKAHYEKEWPLFFSGSGAVMAFAPRDLDTAEILSKIIGCRQEMVQTETNSGGSLTPQAIPLVRPEDLMRLERGQTVNLIEPCPWPVLAQAPVYPQTPYAAGLDPNPYFRG
jgi:type IV secretion system protein VirD4